MSYADLADLAIPAPIAAHVSVERARALSERDAPNVPVGYRRFLIEARVAALIRGPAEFSQQVRYLVDMPNVDGRRARIRRGTEYLVLAAPAPNRPGEIRLIAPDAQLPYAPATAERLRAILRESTHANAAPRITGIGRAFHVPGSLPGESETQYFLQTADGRPISLTVLRRPGETPRWAVALSEIVDNSAEPPARDTLLWYRLACTLPATLPRQSLSEAAPDEARAIEADYRVIKQGLGACERNRRPR
ncbi:hypothetical protein RCO27_18265 [Sphingosinicella sp. LHD-64]|uniref:hypothetical protein n=1 Tax=Sphingosinicella sp. LHD-64 TaxID=3072139 RepID=UPI00280E23DF|nr:hypothetical protein [Sphingosinicella sp. LHD-64]MDQ8758176.1 hypothetical protein [Sphingosinicella sp. LHD-64]